MTRTEHVNWSKERALAELNAGDIPGAWTSMVSDLGKHPETQNHDAIMLGNMMLMSGNLSQASAMEKFIKDFN